jgi:uncharacterized membrane protein YphA (DoxX/SURF4 family)
MVIKAARHSSFDSNIFSHHFSLGFMWVMPGGGWEFAVLWTMLIFSFAVTGAHAFSLDHIVSAKPKAYLSGCIKTGMNL